MDYSEVKILVEKYWNGDTDLEEEARLKQFFEKHSGPLPDDLKETAGLFGYFKEERKRGMNDAGFEAAISNMMRQPPEQRGRVVGFGRKLWKYAAAIIILLTAGYFVIKQPQTTGKDQAALTLDTYTDPDSAFAATKAALALVSANLNKGKNGMQKIALFDEAQQKVSEK
ncbi:MAG TPA: hypothetical protein VIU45_02695 [Chitinophagaceae bacterium]